MLTSRVQPSRSDAAPGNRKREMDPKTAVFRQDQVQDFDGEREPSRRKRPAAASTRDKSVRASEWTVGAFLPACVSD